MPEMQNAAEMVYEGSVVAPIDPSVCRVNVRQYLELARRSHFRSSALRNRCFGARRRSHGHPNGKAREGQRTMNPPEPQQHLSSTHCSLAGVGSRSVLVLAKHAKGPQALLHHALHNPSIEVTSTSKLRLLAAAPHVKR
jgi:hypothetical protein